MSRYIDADELYERIKADEELARDRVIDTPNSFPNGAVNPSAIRYMAQLGERTRFKEMVCDAPTADVRENERSEWVRREGIGVYCNVCQHGWVFIQGAPEEVGRGRYKYCPFCGAKMEGVKNEE